MCSHLSNSYRQNHIFQLCSKVYFINFYFVNFPLCQHWPNGNWQSGKLTEWEWTNWELTKWGLTKWEDTDLGWWYTGMQIVGVVTECTGITLAYWRTSGDTGHQFLGWYSVAKPDFHTTCTKDWLEVWLFKMNTELSPHIPRAHTLHA